MNHPHVASRRSRLAIAVSTVVALSLVGLVAPTAAASGSGPGDLDPTFGSGGKVTTDFTVGRNDYAWAVVLLGGGKIVAAGSSDDGYHFALAGYNADGTLDSSFGTGGRVITDFAQGFVNEEARAAAVDSDSKIVVAGYASSDFALARYNPDGTLDTSFGVGGKVTTDFAGGSDAGLAAVLQGDGKIVVAGNASSDFALARYNPDGTLDTSFGVGGKVTTDLGGDLETAAAVALQGDGKIVTVGWTLLPAANGPDFALARYNPDGTLDSTFGTGGKVTTDFEGRSDTARAVALQAGGEILAAGSADLPPGFSGQADFALARYNEDGTLDTSFGTGGKVTTEFTGSNDQANAMALEGSGKILAAGSAVDDFALARYNPDGTSDSTFGTGGKVTTDFSFTSDAAFAMAIQGDGRIVAAGYHDQSEFALARYLNGSGGDTTDPTVTGTPDRVANPNGWYSASVTIDWTATDDSGTASDPANTVAATEGTQTYTSSPSCDPSNNCASGSLDLSIDLSNPTVTCNPAAFAVGQSGAAVTASVTDAVSGPVASTVSTPANTTTAGSFSASLTGTDRSGRTTTVSCPYTVGQPHTSTSIASTANPTTYGQALQFVATVTNIDTATIPKGKVQFKVDGNNFGNPITLDATGKATTSSYLALPAGAHTVTAVFTGQNGTFVGSTSNTITQTVNPASTSMTLTSSPNPPFWGQSTKFTVKLTNTATSLIPKGSVQLQIDGVNSGAPLTLDSTGTALSPYINLTAGTHTVRAVYTGLNGNFANNERTISQLVKPDVTAVAVSSSKNPSTVGTDVTFTAVVTNSTYGSLKPTGTAQLRVDGAPVGSPVTLDAMSKAKFTISTLSAGDHTISVVYTSSDGNFQSSTGTMAKFQTVK
jgi:uncharacterized delta-60 repeat protein